MQVKNVDCTLIFLTTAPSDILIWSDSPEFTRFLLKTTLWYWAQNVATSISNIILSTNNSISKTLIEEIGECNWQFVGWWANFLAVVLWCFYITPCRRYEGEICNCNMVCIRFYTSFRLQTGTSNSHILVQLRGKRSGKKTAFVITAEFEIWDLRIIREYYHIYRVEQKKILLSLVAHVPSGLMGCALAA